MNIIRRCWLRLRGHSVCSRCGVTLRNASFLCDRCLGALAVALAAAYACEED